MTILREIIENQKLLVEQRKKTRSIDQLMEAELYSRKTVSITNSIKHNPFPSIIAEFKRRSPSKPNINIKADINKIPVGYQDAGATGISILTNEKYFGGSDLDISSIRNEINIPILRKEFIVDEYQIYESKAIGADFILLIAEALTKTEINDFAKKAKELEMEVLMELYDEEGIEKISEYVDIVGVNNRNLKNFNTSIETSKNIYSKLPSDVIKISESGIKDEKEVIELFKLGFKGFLIGENFMKNENIVETTKIFISNLQKI